MNGAWLVVRPEPAQVLAEILGVARAEKLSSYDATYLELAPRSGAVLATKDKALRQAALRNGLTVLPT